MQIHASLEVLLSKNSYDKQNVIIEMVTYLEYHELKSILQILENNLKKKVVFHEEKEHLYMLDVKELHVMEWQNIELLIKQ